MDSKMTELEKKQKRAAYARKYKQRPEVRAKKRAWARAWEKRPEQRARRLAKQKEWRAMKRLTVFGKQFLSETGIELQRDELSRDRDAMREPPMAVYPLRLPAKHLDLIRYLAKNRDRTRQSLIREAVRQWLDKQVSRPNKNMEVQ